MADDEGRRRRRHHFLVVAYGVQSHVNPGRALARRLVRLSGVDGSITATLCVPVLTYRRMFPSSSLLVLDAATATLAEQTTDGVISYIPYSDGLDDGSMPADAEARARRRRASADSLAAIVARLAGRGQPVTCIVSTMLLLSALHVAREHGIPLAVYWLQPATVLAVTYHYFHGLDEVVHATATDDEVRAPGLSRPIRIGNLPTFLTNTSGSDGSDRALFDVFRELFEFIDDQWQRPKVLVNTFGELEPTALAEMKRHLDVVAVGPMVGSATDGRIHLFEHDDKTTTRYMEWLGAHPDSSVVYVSFGSLTKVTKRQMEEIAAGLRQCGRPYLLVVRRDGVAGGGGGSHGLETTQRSQGMVVEWCNQLEVLSQPAVGCFVSHCGWNSTMEAIASGVPIVGVPNGADQPTNMYLIEEEWGIGVRGERNSDGVLTGTELARCIELVMGDGAGAVATRERAKALKQTAQAAAGAGGSGSAERNLCELVKTMSNQYGLPPYSN